MELDGGPSAAGRGAYLHRTLECLELARRRHSLERALKASTNAAFWEALIEPAGAHEQPEGIISSSG